MPELTLVPPLDELEESEVDLDALVDEFRRVVDAPMTANRRARVEVALERAARALRGKAKVRRTRRYWQAVLFRVGEDEEPVAFVKGASGQQTYCTSERAAVAPLPGLLAANPKARWAEVWLRDHRGAGVDGNHETVARLDQAPADVTG